MRWLGCSCSNRDQGKRETCGSLKLNGICLLKQIFFLNAMLDVHLPSAKCSGNQWQDFFHQFCVKKELFLECPRSEIKGRGK